MRTSFTYRRLHSRVANEVADDIPGLWFYGGPRDGSGQTPFREYSTHVMGFFKCNNEDCSQPSWASKKIAIHIRGYRKKNGRIGYNAEVFNQRCKSCHQLGALVMDEESYVERVVYRVKVWAEVPVERQQRCQKRGLPHVSELCEGCKAGVCKEGL
jgi:hypothetical protein